MLRVAETSVATALCGDTAGDTAACTAETFPKTSIRDSAVNVTFIIFLLY
ncbi:MAG: hypothetical protein KBD36_00395 [Alphaproteobacteria bacterium]|nr:hypothetical protein [Alphaproteobacteria bacterium]